MVDEHAPEAVDSAAATSDDAQAAVPAVEFSAGGDGAGAPRRRRRSASRPAGPPMHHEESVAETAEQPAADDASESGEDAAAEVEPDATEEPVADAAEEPGVDAAEEPVEVSEAEPEPTEPEAEAAEQPAARRPRRATRGVTTVSFSSTATPEPVLAAPPAEAPAIALFQPPDETKAVRRRRNRAADARAEQAADEAPRESTEDVIEPADVEPLDGQAAQPADEAPDAPEATERADDAGDADDSDEGPRRRRRRGGRRRRRGGQGGAEGESSDEGDESDDLEVTERAERVGRAGASDQGSADASDETVDAGADSDEGEGEASEEGGGGSRRRRRRRRRAGVAEEMEDLSTDDASTVVKVRESRRNAADEITSVRGSTRIEAKRQRRRDGRDAGRRRAPILTEAEFLARRESVNRVMCVREHGDRVQIAVLEDGVLVEHYVNRADSSSMVGNVYLGKVQNVLPSMEAAFVDIGRGRNAVLYAGEVNWEAAGLEGQPKRIELALKSGDPVLVQVTKDPIGHKGARLTSQISLPGRYLVYVPEGSMTGISRKLPDTERARLKGILKDIVPEGAGVIVRTAAEGATEEQLADDVNRLTTQWKEIQRKAKSATPPSLLYGEPDLVIKVVRDIFNEDFTSLVVQGAGPAQTLSDYIGWVAPDLLPKLSEWTDATDLYTAHRIDEQLAKALDRKVWLPSGGSLVIDRTEAMTVVDVNTGKFTGKGGNLEETVTRNNLEAAEEIVRQLRLRDVGGIIVVDFIDMVLESNRDLVLRRLVECLGRDRTKHQVAEVTSLGLVQMTRKRIGQGLLEVFSTPCEHCGGRGHVVHVEPVGADGDEANGRRDRDRDRDRGGRRGRQAAQLPVNLGGKQTGKVPPPPKFDEHGHIDHSGDVHEGEPIGEVESDDVIEPGDLGELVAEAEPIEAGDAAPFDAEPIDGEQLDLGDGQQLDLVELEAVELVDAEDGDTVAPIGEAPVEDFAPVAGEVAEQPEPDAVDAVDEADTEAPTAEGPEPDADHVEHVEGEAPEQAPTQEAV